ncbi:hypothetical protein RJ55_06799 [Drechmeria coniospora]|nr:hypothetical protein RJ55_06799 [Drechmeria coniospora]
MYPDSEQNTFTSTSQQRVTLMAAAGVAVIGVGIYSNTGRSTSQTPETYRRKQAQSKRELGIGGAGIGATFNSGGPEGKVASPGRQAGASRAGTTESSEKPPRTGAGADSADEPASASSNRRRVRS